MKFRKLMLAVLTTLLLLAFSACTVTELVEPDAPIFKGFSVIDAHTYSLEVSNSTLQHDFADVVTVGADSTWKLARDANGQTVLADRIAPLVTGDNTFYVIVETKGASQSFEMRIRRRGTFSITFNSAGGSAVGTVTVEEGVVITAPPRPTRAGFSFISWGYDFSNPITENLSLTAEWKANTYNIIFRSTLHETTKTLSATFNTPVTLLGLSAFSRAGYTLLGWNTTADGSGTPYALDQTLTYTATANLDLIAQWETIEYSISYHLNGGTNHADNPTIVTAASPLIELLPATKTGYSFGGWYSDPTFTAPFGTIHQGTTDNVTVYAKYNPITYNINYFLYSGTNAFQNPQSYDVLTPDITLQPASRTNYTFAGWFTDALFTAPITSIPTGSVGNLDLHAYYIPIEYEINYVLDGGTNHADNPAYYNITTPLTSLSPAEKVGFNFGGWHTNSAFTNPKTAIGGGEVGNCTLYALFTPIAYALSFHLDGQTTNTQNPSTYNILSPLTELAPPAKPNYDFIGWHTAPELNAPITHFGGGEIGEIDLYPEFAPTVFSITYHLDGATNHPDNPTEYTVLTTAQLHPAKRAGYSFEGWFSDAALTIEVSEIALGTFDITDLYASFAPAPFIITYILSGATNHPSNPDEYTVLTPATQLFHPTKLGFIFVGWFDINDMSRPVEYIRGEMMDDITLYAVFYPVVYSVSYHLDDGTNHPSNPTAFDIETPDPLAPTKHGYAFDGWFTDAAFNDAFTAFADYTRDLDLYAKFTLQTYDITYHLDGGTNHPSNPATFNINSASLDNPTKTGYTFDGWFTDADFAEAFTAFADYSADLDLYALFTIITHDITYHLDGGTNHIDNPTTYDSTTPALSDPTKDDHTFDGWFTDESFANPFTSFADYTGDLVLYAKFTPDEVI